MKRIRAGFAPVGGIAIVFFLTPHAVHSQTFASISGVVKDSAGKFVSDAQVSIKDVDTAQLTEIKTNADGSYAESKLIPGRIPYLPPRKDSNSQTSNVILIAAKEEHTDFVLTMTPSNSRKPLRASCPPHRSRIRKHPLPGMPMLLRYRILALAPTRPKAARRNRPY